MIVLIVTSNYSVCTKYRISAILNHFLARNSFWLIHITGIA